jgi:hypothetical protein
MEVHSNPPASQGIEDLPAGHGRELFPKKGGREGKLSVGECQEGSGELHLLDGGQVGDVCANF